MVDGRTNAVISRATQWRHGGGRRFGAGVLAVVLLALGLVTFGPARRADAGPAPVMTGYVPMPAADYQAMFESINPAADATLDYQVGITNAGAGSVMYYDHWEDGFEADIANPVQATTEVWGDGNLANGNAAAAGRCGAACAGDLLTPGDVFTLRNNIAIPRVAADIRFDGRDKVASTRGFSVSVITWTTPLGSVLAGSVAAYDTTKYGRAFVFPVGQDTPFPAGENDPFQFAGASIMAASANTQVQVDADGDGTFETNVTIGEGETHLVNGGVNQGGRVVADKPVQVHMVTGDVGDSYESRSYIVLPLSLLSGSYISPVGSSVSNYETILYIYNPNDTDISVTPTCTGTGCGTPITVPANDGAIFQTPLGQAVGLDSAGGERFEVFGANGSRSGVAAGQPNDSANWDWGFTLIPTAQLTTQVVLAAAPANSSNPPGSAPAANANDGPVWVTSLTATTIRVDFDGDPSTGAIASADCFGSNHDLEIAVSALASTRIIDSADKDMTGARIYTCDGTKIAGAWGEDPQNAPTGSPGLDAGYTLIPTTTMIVNKTGGLFSDTNGDGKFSPGDVIEYEISIADAGSLAFTSVNAQDVLPAGVSYIPGSTTFDNGVVNPIADDVVPPAGTVFPLDETGTSLPNINAGQTVFLRYRAAIDDPRLAAGTILSNLICVEASEADACDIEETPLTESDLSLTKAVTTAPTLVGDDATFQITVSNAGPDEATGIEVTDVLPAGLVFQSSSASQGSYNSGTGIWTVGTLASGASATLDLTAQVNVTAATNFAQISKAQAADPDSEPVENPLGPSNPPDQDDEDSADVTASPIPNLAVTKDDGGTSTTPGGTVAYTLSYANNGAGGATGVVLTETVPANSSFNAGASTAGWVCAPDGNAGSTCTLAVGALAAGANGSATFAVTVANPLPAGVTQIANTVTIDGDQPDEDPTDDTDSDDTPVTAAPDLAVTKDDGGVSTTPGGTVAYTIDYVNNGNQGAAGVVLSETVPANSSFNAGASTAGWVCVPNGNAGSSCTLPVGNLAAGANGSATFAVTVANPLPAGVTQVANTVTVADDGTNGPDPTPGDNTDSDDTPVTAAPDLAVTKDDGGVSTTPGGTVAYTIDYVNNGNQDATGVVLSETVPANSSFNAGASTAGWVCVPDGNAGSTCTLPVGNLAAAANGSATFAVTVANPLPAGVTEVANTVAIADDGTNGPDPTPGDNTDDDTTPVTASPDLAVTKDDGGVSTTPGGTVAYTIDYVNNGNQDATGVVLSETVPANSTFNAGASTAGWVCVPDGNAGSTCTLPVGNLAAGANGSATFAVTVANPLPAGVTQVANTVTISGDHQDPTPGDNTDSDDTPVDAAPDLAVTKDDGGVSTTPGGTVAYTIDYANNGNQDATGVVLSETVPANSSFNAGASTAGWVCVPDGNAGSTCTLPVGNLAAGANGSATFAVTVANPLPAGVTQVANTVTVADDGTNGPDPTPGDNTDDDTTPVDAAPDLAVTKDDGGASTTPGGTVAYTIDYVNNGNQGATGVVLSETVPANSTFNAGASTAGWVCVPDGNAGSTCTLPVGNLAAGANGSATFAVTVANPLPAGVTQVANTVTVADDGTNGPDPTPDNTDSDDTPVVAAPDLTVTKTDGDVSTTPGGTVAYTIGYANVGNVGATGVVLSETVPADSSFNAGASTAGWVCVPDGNAGSTCTLPVGNLAAGANGSATFAVTVANPLPAGVTEVANTVTVADDGANGADPTPNNNTASDTTPVDAAPDLAVTKDDGGASTTAGGTVAYTIGYANNGNQGAAGVVLTETVPANSSFNAGASTAGWVCVPDGNAGSTCTLPVGSLAAGANGSATFAVTVANPLPAGVTQVANTATVADDGTNGPDPTPGDNTDDDTTPVDAAPDLAVTKDDGGASTTPGGTVAYTIDYVNNGNQGATGVVLSETVPANSTFNAGASTAGWVCVPDGNAGSTCTLPVGNLAAGANGSATFAVTVANPLPAGVTQVANTVTVADDGTNGPDPTPGDNTDSDDTPVSAAPDLAVTKDDAGASTTPGGTVAYTIDYVNNGNQDATGVVLSETVPANSTFNAGASTAGWVCVPDGNAGSTCTLPVGSLAAGANGSATFAVSVASPLPAGVTQVANTVSISGDQPDPTPDDNTDEDTTPVVAAPDLTVTKTDGDVSTTPGGTVAYTIGYANVGNVGATGVVLSETVPADSSFNAGASTAGWVCVPDGNAGSTCTLPVGSLAAGANGSATFAVTVANPLPAGVTQVANTVTVADDGANGADPTPNNNTASDTTPVDAAPDLAVTKDDGGASTTPGGTVAYTLSYVNNGNQGASGVVLSETVPANSSFNAGASTAGWVCVPDGNAGSTCTLPVGNLAAGANGSATFAVTVANPLPAGVTQVANTVTVADDGTNGPDPTPGDNTDSDDTPVSASPDLAVTKDDGGASTTPGGTVAYTIDYVNNGNQDATGVTVTETVPANSSFNAGASTASWVCVPDGNAGSTCTLPVGNLAAGANGSATFAVTVANPLPAGVTQVANTVSISGDQPDPTPGDNTDEDTTPVSASPDLAVTKDDAGASTTPGGTVAYTIDYVNNGNQDATGVTVTETVPANSSFNAGASTAGWVCVPDGNAGSTCTLPVGALVAGANGSATFAVTVASPLPAGVTQVANSVSISGDQPDPTPGDNTDEDTTPVVAAPDLTVTKTDGGVSTTPGGTVAYTIGYANAGNVGATGVVLSETVPANSTFNAGASTAGWVCVPDGNAGSTCTLPVGSLAAGANGSATFAVTVASPLPAGVTQVANTVTVADDGANGADPTPNNNTASDTTPVDAAPDLAVTKDDGGASTTPGGTVAYTLSYVNNGNQGATGVVLSETVPANSTFNAGASTAGWVCVPDGNAGSTCTLLVGNLAVGANGSATFAVTVAGPPSSVTQIDNTVTITDDGTNGPEPEPDDNTDTDSTPVAGAVIGDRVWNDVDGDGVQDGGEAGVPGVTVELLDSSAAVIGTTTTDGSGLYTFAGLAPGEYSVRVTAPSGVGTTTPTTVPVTLSAGQVVDTADFGLRRATIGDRVWDDLDGDGVQDPGEPGVAGVTVELLDFGGAVVASTTTNASGDFSFGDLLAGDYELRFVAPAGRFFAVPNAGLDDAVDSDAAVLTGRTGLFALAAGQVDTSRDAGLVVPSSLAGVVFSDLDGDGTQDPGEPGIGGATVTLTGTDDLGTPVNVVTATLADGTYSFTNLRPGTYTVTETQPAGYFDGIDTAGSAGGSTAVNDVVSGVVLAPGTAATGYRFAELAPASVGDRVWRDADGDGVDDPGEAGLPGVTVTLLRDGDSDGSYETTVGTDTTDAAGAYGFGGLPPGDYRVVVDGATAPAGYTPTTPTSFDRPLAPAASVTDADAGFLPPPGSIGDTVFLDRDGDGTQDPGEPGLPAVTVTLLRDVDGDGTYETTVGTTTTDPTGSYAFVGQPTGDYRVVVTPPAGFTTSTPAQLDRTLPEGGSITDADFGILGATIGDRVYNDLDADGVQDPGEGGIAGVTVELLEAGGVVLTSTVTDATGAYAFTGLEAGDYDVRFVAPAGALFAPPNVGADDAVDSDAAVLTGRVGVFSVVAGQTDTSRDAGLIAPSSLAGVVFSDLDNDGTQDPGEPGIAGATVTLTGTDDLGNPVNVVAVTAANGTYSFTNLRPGTYVVTETQPGGYLDGTDAAGTAGGSTAVDDVVSSIVLPAGSVASGYTFAELVPASVSGRVFDDLDDDGVADPGEPGLPGVTVTLTGTDDRGNPVNAVAVTVADGSYSFADLRPGTYTVTETQPPTKLDGTDTVGSLGGTLANDVISTIPVTPGATGTGYLFAEVSPASLGDRIWSDVDGGGDQDAGEPGLPGVTVTLLRDVDGDGTYETTVGSDTTDADGLYLFEQLRPGRYRVTVDAASLPPEVTPTTPVPVDRVLTGGQSVTDADVGYLPAPPPIGQIGDRVWSDTDGDGVQDAGEPGLGGVVVSLLQDTDSNGSFETTVGSFITTGAGDYVFSGLPAGSYQVVATPPSGQTATTPVTIDVPLAKDEVRLDADFGFRPPAPPAPASIGDRVWDDVDGDGVQDPGEAGVGGVTVTLRQDTDGNGSFETAAAVQLTAADGSYEFANLPVGRYQVVVAVPSGQNPTTPIAVVADLSGGEVIDTADFGLRSTPAPVGSIGDTVWNDGNGNGVQDPGELGLENVTVTLLRDGDGDGVYETPVGSDITDAAGTYGFTALPPGSYRVVVTPPTGFSPTSPPVIGVELSGGGVVTDADFGLDDVAVVPGTIGDRVWSDTDRDGVQDAGEPGLNGVTVTLLRDGNGDGTYETTASSTVTAGDGGYGFTDVPPGAYLVVVTAPPGQSPTTPSTIVVNLATAQDVTDADVGMATPPPVPFDLALTKSLEGQLRNGDPATWLIEVTNNGIVASPNPVTVVDVLPTGLTYTGFTGTGWSCSAAGSTVTCTLPESIPVGATRQLRITTQVALAAGTEVTNTGTVSAEGVEITLENNSDQAIGQVQPQPTTTTTAPPTSTTTTQPVIPTTGPTLPPTSITTGTTTTGTLPVTGSDTWRLALIAMGLVTMGSALVLLRRRLTR